MASDDAVIGEFHRKAATIARPGLCHAPGQVIGLAAGVHEDNGAEAFMREFDQPLGIVRSIDPSVARVGVELPRLPGNGLGHIGMAVPHMGTLL